MSPIDIIANAMRTADGNHAMGTGQLAGVAAGALTDDRIVANAVAALMDDRWEGYSGELTASHLVNIARTVLSSVGGA